MFKQIIFPFVFKRICPCDIFHSNIKCWKNNLQLPTEEYYISKCYVNTLHHNRLILPYKSPQIYRPIGSIENRNYLQRKYAGSIFEQSSEYKKASHFPVWPYATGTIVVITNNIFACNNSHKGLQPSYGPSIKLLTETSLIYSVVNKPQWPCYSNKYYKNAIQDGTA